MQIIDHLLSLSFHRDDVADADYLMEKLVELESLRQMGEVSGPAYYERAAELRGRLDRARGLAVN